MCRGAFLINQDLTCFKFFFQFTYYFYKRLDWNKKIINRQFYVHPLNLKLNTFLYQIQSKLWDFTTEPANVWIFNFQSSIDSSEKHQAITGDLLLTRRRCTTNTGCIHLFLCVHFQWATIDREASVYYKIFHCSTIPVGRSLKNYRDTEEYSDLSLVEIMEIIFNNITTSFPREK